MNLILGGGIAGLAASWHLGHDRCLVLEKSDVVGGHARSVAVNGFTLDHGPHVSFTRNAYVRDLFARNVGGSFIESDVTIANFYQRKLVHHPAQVHLWQLPEPLRSSAAAEMRQAAIDRSSNSTMPPVTNYDDWLRRSFGPSFSAALPAAYTRKYWTVGPDELSADWVGPRMHTPSLQDIDLALIPGSRNNAHYITRIRYPVRGGFEAFFRALGGGAHVLTGMPVTSIDLNARRVTVANAFGYDYTRLISTIPLPTFIRLCVGAPDHVLHAAASLDCSQVLLVDVFAPQTQQREHSWYYVYDEDFLSTRIHCVEKLSTLNAPPGFTGIQVEVYASRARPLPLTAPAIARRVTAELVQLGFLNDTDLSKGNAIVRWRWCPFANVMFTLDRRDALDTIWSWLETKGLLREPDDLAATTAWGDEETTQLGSIIMAGRFAQWKYFWTDDCVLRAARISKAL